MNATLPNSLQHKHKSMATMVMPLLSRSKNRLAEATRHIVMAAGIVTLTILFLIPFYSLAFFEPHLHSLTASGHLAFLESLASSSSSAASSTTTGASLQQNTGTKKDACLQEYKRVTANAVPGLTAEDLERSVAYTGNRHRLAQLVQKLKRRQEAVSVAICGGSITMGHGVEPSNARYSDQLEVRLNKAYPLTSKTDAKSGQALRHRVHNRGSHGADMCAMAKRINFLNLPTPPDLFVLEFAVNDYQGQDHKVYIDHKTDVFFDGFAALAECAEIVVYKLLADYPQSAVVFLEFQTAILNRKTAQLLHMGVAQHYQVPVLSYADTLWPSLYTLFDKLKDNKYSVSKDVNIETIQPYPHGCAPCQAEHISAQFREFGCKSICVFASRSNFMDAPSSDQCDLDAAHRPCHVPFLAHDAVHPSAVGHEIASDLILNLVANTDLLLCQDPNRRPFVPHVLPSHSGWMVGGSNYHNELRKKSDFVLVQDTMEIFANQNPLQSNTHSKGFELKSDELQRKGWIAENAAGGETVTYDIKLPVGECYVIILSVLRSYERVGSFTVTVEDVDKKTTTAPLTFDCKWKSKISVPADVTITSDDGQAQCTGRCKVTVTTLPQIKDGRNGNMIKIMSLAVRKCIVSAKN